MNNSKFYIQNNTHWVFEEKKAAISSSVGYLLFSNLVSSPSLPPSCPKRDQSQGL